MRVTIGQINTTNGDYEGNVARILDAIEKAKKDASDLIVFPEVTIQGYTSLDWFLDPDVVRSALQPLSKRIVVAFVYGSVAREEETAQSDVDLMIVGKATLDEILSRLSTVEKSIGRPINPTVYSVEEFKAKLASGNHFLTAVLKGQKEFLLGDEDELRKVGGVRLAKAGADQPA